MSSNTQIFVAHCNALQHRERLPVKEHKVRSVESFVHLPCLTSHIYM